MQLFHRNQSVQDARKNIRFIHVRNVNDAPTQDQPSEWKGTYKGMRPWGTIAILETEDGVYVAASKPFEMQKEALKKKASLIDQAITVAAKYMPKAVRGVTISALNAARTQAKDHDQCVKEVGRKIAEGRLLKLFASKQEGGLCEAPDTRFAMKVATLEGLRPTLAKKYDQKRQRYVWCLDVVPEKQEEEQHLSTR